MSEPTEVLWGIGTLIGMISTQLVNELRLAGFPDLEEGQILFGKKFLSQRKAPPSVVAVWLPSGATGAEWGLEVPSPGSSLAQPVLNALATDLMRLEFHCWAQAQPPDPGAFGDAQACQFLYSQLWRCIHRMTEGSYKMAGVDPSIDPPTTLGYAAALRVEFRVPIVDNLLAYVPPGIKSAIVVAPSGAPASDAITVQTGALTS